jgi:hypothetical protein
LRLADHCLFACGQLHLASAAFVAFGLLNTTAGLFGILAVQFACTLWAMTGFYQSTRPPVVRCLLITAACFLIASTLSLLIGNLIVQAGLLEPVESLVA